MWAVCKVADGAEFEQAVDVGHNGRELMQAEWSTGLLSAAAAVCLNVLQ